MMKRVLIICLAALFSAVVPSTVHAASVYVAGIMEIRQDQDMKDITVSYSDGVLEVIGGEGLNLEVVSITGKKVLDVRIDSPALKIELNIPKGCYIVKVGKAVRKVSVR
jgi:uncharacterized membrane protein